MVQLSNILNSLTAISLKELDEVSLLNRIDKKYIVPIHQLTTFIQLLQNEYQILEIDNNRQFSYETTYYDTDDFQFYKDHHNGLTHRLKVRYRTYKENNLHFFEIKRKIKGYRTEKYREKITKDHFEFDQIHIDFVRTFYARKPFEYLSPTLYNSFSRITLVNNEMTEKCTIDYNIEFLSDQQQKVSLSTLAIIEIKQNKATLSAASQILKQLRIYPSPFSKYVVGLLLTKPHIKYNAFKFLLRKVEKSIISNSTTTSK